MDQNKPYFLEIDLGGSDDSGKAYDALYKEIDLAQIESFYVWLFDHIPLPGTGELLDVGCGSGEVLQLATDKGLHAVGVDISMFAAYKAAQKTGRGIRICVAAGEDLPFPSHHFDIVTNIGSLEHFIDPAVGIRELNRVLKHNGTIAILVPNTFSLLSNVWSVLRKGQIAIDHQPIQRYGTNMDWTLLLHDNGLHIQKTIKYERSWPRSSRDWGFYLRKPKDFIRLLLSPIIPTNLAYAFLFVCRTRDDNPEM